MTRLQAPLMPLKLPAALAWSRRLMLHMLVTARLWRRPRML
jgi:hypothetical protein